MDARVYWSLEEKLTTAYLPFTRHFGSSFWTRSSVPSGRPTTVSALQVRSESMSIWPRSGPRASSNGVVVGHQASLTSLR